MKRYCKLILIPCFVLCQIYYISTAPASEPPYPPSQVVNNIDWNTSTLVRKASGSDNWASTWGSDGNIYTTWGDGGGFGGSDAGLGVARISGPPENFKGTNVWSVPRGYYGGKSEGIISVDGVLFMWVGPGSGWEGATKTWLQWSNDLGKNWQRSEIFFTYTDGFSKPTFLNFGKDNAGARDDYIYFYGYDRSAGKTQKTHKLNFGRVLKNQIKDRTAYKFLNAFDGDGNPLWTADVNERFPVFVDVGGGIADSPSIIYNAGIKRYILSKTHNPNYPSSYPSGGLGVFEAPEPWGPWRTIAYTDNWMGSNNMFFAEFPTKWISEDGLTLWMIFTGFGNDAIARDAYQHMQCTFTISETTPPNAPTNLTPIPRNDSQVDLTWIAAEDPETGISFYNIYRDGVKVATSLETSFNDTNLKEITTYIYEVSAINGAGQEGPMSSQASVKTLSDSTAPSIISVSAVGDPKKVTVFFSEQVEQSSATTISNYSIDNDITVFDVSQGGDLASVILATSSHSEDIVYTLTANNVRDRSTAHNTIAPNSSATYTYVFELIISNLNPADYQTSSLKEGDTYYIDRTYTITSIPASYQNLLWIKTGNEDKGSTGSSFLTFDANQAVTVYIAYNQKIASIPTWLTNWTNEGQSIQTSNTTFNLYSKNYPQGRITLGGNYGSSNDNMYAVLIKPSGQTGDIIPPAPPTGLEIM